MWVNAIFHGVGKQNREISTAPFDGFQHNLLTPSTLYNENYWSHYNTKEENLKAKYPRLTGLSNQQSNNRFSDFWIINGAYFRLKNVTVGYSIPKEWTNMINVEEIKLNLTATDLLSIDNFPKGIDPEQGYGAYFITKSFLIGAKIKF